MMVSCNPARQIVVKLACEADVWYNGGTKNSVASAVLKHPEAWIRSRKERIVFSISSCAKNGKSFPGLSPSVITSNRYEQLDSLYNCFSTELVSTDISICDCEVGQ